MIIASYIHINEDPSKRPSFMGSIRTAVENDEDRTLIIAGDLTFSAKQKEYEEVIAWFRE